MVAGDKNDGCFRQSVAKALKLPEGEDNRVVGWPHRVKEVPGNYYHVWPHGNNALNGGPEGLSNIGFSLVDAARSLPVILPDTEMGVSNVGQFHGWRMGLNAVKSKHLGGRHEATEKVTCSTHRTNHLHASVRESHAEAPRLLHLPVARGRP